MEDRPGRILVVDDDRVVLRWLEVALGGAGVAVETVREATQAVPRAIAFQPDLILVDRHMPVLNGGEIVRALRAFPQTAGIHVAFITADLTEANLIRCIRSGALDVILKPIDEAHVERILALLKEVRDAGPCGPPTPESQARALLDVFRRDARDGTLRVNPGTPFEGRALFAGGALRTAEFGPLSGVAAIEEMIGIEDAVWRFDRAPAPEGEQTRRLWIAPPEERPRTAPPASLSDQTRLLLVDDDPDLRRLFKAQLARADFEVDLAEDGREGVQLARAREYDLIVADVNMPRLDGWGMLRELRADYRTREIPVIFLSAHDDYRETLQAARCGAWDYLPKTGRADGVIDRAQAALGPRQRAAADLLEGVPGEMDMGLLGPRWLLRTLARQKATGVVSARDEWAAYRIAIRGGAPVWARANAAGRETTGVSAVGAFLVSRAASGEFTRQAIEEPATFDVGMEDLLDATCAALNELEARAATNLIRQAGPVEVDEDLYQLYRRVSSDRDLMIARALCEEKVPAQQLASRLQLPPEVVEAGIADLLRRRVIRIVRPGGP